MKSPRFDEIMKNEERRASETSNLMKTLSSIVERLSEQFEDLTEGGAEQKQKSLIRNIISKIKRRRKQPDAEIIPSNKTLIEDVNLALIDIEREDKK